MHLKYIPHKLYKKKERLYKLKIYIHLTQIFAENLILQQYIYFQEVINFSPLPVTFLCHLTKMFEQYNPHVTSGITSERKGSIM